MTLLYLGLLVLLGFACQPVLKRVGMPAITGYMIVGILLGPSALSVVEPSAMADLKPLGAFCLATLFFLLGEEFKLHELKRLGGRFLLLTLAQALVTFLVVTELLLLIQVPIAAALLLGAIASTTDPAGTLAVIRETHGRGAFVKTLMAVIALNGLVGMLLFSSLLPVVSWLQGGAEASWSAAFGATAAEFGLSALLGTALALGLRLWAHANFWRGPLTLPTLGMILLGTGACEALHLSPLLVMLTFGALVANTVPGRVQVFAVAKAMEPPLLVIFFTLAGASLHLNELAGLGWIGVVYVGGRILGKLLGGAVGATMVGESPSCQRYLGAGLIPQASMAIGLAYVVQERFPELAGPVLPVALGAIVVFETIGPLMARLAIRKAEIADPAPVEAPVAEPAWPFRLAGVTFTQADPPPPGPALL